MQTPLVLLPGMMCDARLFSPVVNQLSSRRPITCFPLVGNNTIEGLASSILKHACPTFSLAGLSMGGIVAMEIVRQAPERVERIALLDTNPLAETSEKAASREPQIQSVRDGNLWTVMRDEMKPNYLTDGPERGRILDLCMQMAMDLGPDVFIDQSDALKLRRDYSDTLRGTDKPALILCGEDDELCPVERHEYMHSLMPHSTLQVIQGAGHLVVQEQPELACAALEHWLTGVS